MSRIVNVSRRNFLKTSAVAGGSLVLGLYLPGAAHGDEGDEAQVATFAPNAFLRVDADGSVTVIINHSEMGQGISTALAMIIADEMDTSWESVRTEFAPVDPAYNHTAFGPLMITGGSTTMWSEWDRYREMGAAGRAMLVTAAAREWGVETAACSTSEGRVRHEASGRALGYGELVARASRLEPPAEVTTKSADRYRIIGQPTKRLDAAEKSDGTAIFGLDVDRPELLVAVVARPPVLGAKVKSFDATKAKGVRGLRDVFEIGSGVAVVAEDFWAATQAREALVVDWDEGALATLDSKSQGEQYAEMATGPGKPSVKTGDEEAAWAGAAKRLEAVYELPYLAHAPLEPLNCVADVRADSCEIWVGTQSQTMDLAAAARAAGLEPDQVRLHTTYLGGGFGRRAVIDSHFVVEAVEISKKAKKPVKVVWTREDDVRGGYYRPRAHHAIRGGVDAAGALVGWRQRIVCQSIVAGTPFEAVMFHEGVDHTAVEGAAELPYAIPNRLVEWHQAPAVVPVLWWRSVGHSHNAFVVESFFDELAHAAGRDPVELRLELLAEQPRNRRVLELAAKKAGWGQKAPPGRSRGVAVHASFGAFIAQVAEVSVSEAGRIRVHRVVCAVDCGPVVNPETVRAQMEGGIAFGLTAALHGRITFEKGRVQQSNFHDYPVLRMEEMPEVEVHLVDSQDKMGGIGEPGVPPIAPAVANAVFAATGKRLRRLPFRAQELT